MNRRSYGTSSLLSPHMSDWQGPGACMPPPHAPSPVCVLALDCAPHCGPCAPCGPSVLWAAVYVYNNVEFTPRDFENLSRIGQASKMEKLATTGRFGLGFNSVYHFTGMWSCSPSLPPLLVRLVDAVSACVCRHVCVPQRHPHVVTFDTPFHISYARCTQLRHG
jgi:hypothetical protein